MIFDSWAGVARTLVLGTISYIALITLLRISGKRTLSKMNAFDLVVTVAMGSTLATILLSPEVSLAEGVAALGLLVLLQFAITWTSVRSEAARTWVKSTPTLLLHQGRLLHGAMRAERVTENEILAAVRARGLGSVAHIGAVVLETDGTLSVISASALDSDEVLRGVRT